MRFFVCPNSTVGLCCWYTAGARVLYAQLSSWSTIPAIRHFLGFMARYRRGVEWCGSIFISLFYSPLTQGLIGTQSLMHRCSHKSHMKHYWSFSTNSHPVSSWTKILMSPLNIFNDLSHLPHTITNRGNSGTCAENVFDGCANLFSTKDAAPLHLWLFCVLSLVLLNFFRSHSSKLVFCMCQMSYVLTTCKYLVTTFGRTVNENDERGVDDEMLGIALIVVDISNYVAAVICFVWIFLNFLRRDLMRNEQQSKQILTPGIPEYPLMAKCPRDYYIWGRAWLLFRIRTPSRGHSPRQVKLRQCWASN